MSNRSKHRERANNQRLADAGRIKAPLCRFCGSDANAYSARCCHGDPRFTRVRDPKSPEGGSHA